MFSICLNGFSSPLTRGTSPACRQFASWQRTTPERSHACSSLPPDSSPVTAVTHSSASSAGSRRSTIETSRGGALSLSCASPSAELLARPAPLSPDERRVPGGEVCTAGRVSPRSSAMSTSATPGCLLALRRLPCDSSIASTTPLERSASAWPSAAAAASP